MLQANFMALCFIEPDLLTSGDCRNRDFRYFCSCGFDLDPMTFIYEFYPYSPEIYRMCNCELPTSRLSKVIVWRTDRQTVRQTRPKLYTRRFAGGQNTVQTAGSASDDNWLLCVDDNDANFIIGATRIFAAGGVHS